MRDSLDEPGRGQGTSGGSGLGLAIVREIALLHRGTVSITDHGAGACLVVRLDPAPPPGTAASIRKRDGWHFAALC
ncbi:ATP-binding protein [Microtetraspora malaysiensis]|uniref:ATP-binding protein n=1 Tax=Microtetraspora malaysiensis TaxID=161358 RepID=UPI003D9274F2